MEKSLEQQVDELFERSDERLFAILHNIAKLALENRDPSQEAPISLDQS